MCCILEPTTYNIYCICVYTHYIYSTYIYIYILYSLYYILYNRQPNMNGRSEVSAEALQPPVVEGRLRLAPRMGRAA